jgi:uncharacterized protein with PhoU and TrkA domain
MHFRAKFNADVVALLRKDRIILDNEFKISLDDKFLIRSDIETIEEIKLEFKDTTPFMKMKKLDKEDCETSKISPQLVELVKQDYVKMYVMVETMVELAFASILFSNKEIADDVIEMEDAMDKLNIEFERRLLNNYQPGENTDAIVGILRIVYCLENISDASTNIAEITSKGIHTHPVLSLAFSQTSEVIIKTPIKKNSQVIGKAIEFIEEPEISGGFEVLAIYRNNDWLYNLPDEFIFETKDVIIAQGPKESEVLWRKLLNPKYGEEEDDESDDQSY